MLKITINIFCESCNPFPALYNTGHRVIKYTIFWWLYKCTSHRNFTAKCELEHVLKIGKVREQIAK